MDDTAPEAAPRRRLRPARLLLWQAVAVAVLVAAAAASGRGSPVGIVFGAGLLAASLGLQAWATRVALGGRRPALAVGLFTLKLAILVGVAWVGLSSRRIPPMSFAAGATTLLLAIVVETCYGDWSARRGR